MAGLVAKAKSFISRVLKADIVKVFSLTSISTLVKMCTGLISVKIVASIIGPAGVALVGQLNNFAMIAMSFSSGGINSGITKYIAEYREDNSMVAQLLSNALRITAICSAICAVVLIVFHRYISQLVMLSADYGYVFVIFGITILLYALNNMLISIVNGYKEFRRFVYINIANSIIGVIFTVALVMFWQLKGALISAVTFQSIMLFVTLWMLRGTPWLDLKFFKEKFNRVIAGKYFRYALMTLTTALTVPIVQMLLRGYVMAEISPIEAGWWEGMQRISNMYLMVITTSFSVYYLPRLSEITDAKELRHEIIKSYKVIVPILLLGFSLIYIMRFFVIKLLFTPDFMPMSHLFAWQLAGDFFKICSWLIAYLMVAKAMLKMFIITEIIFSVNRLVISLLLVNINGIIGLTQGYLIDYILYMVVILIALRRHLKNEDIDNRRI